MAYQFDGSGDYLTSTGVLIPTAMPLTIACWFNADSQTATDTLVHVTNSTGGDARGWRINSRGASAGDPVQALQESDSAATGFAISSTGYTAGQWHHACGVFTSTTSRAAYIDGGSKGTNTTNVSAPSSIDGIRVGVASSTAVYFAGRAAEVSVWNVALTDAEVASLAVGFSPLLVRPSALLFYTPLRASLVNLRDIAPSIVGDVVVAADHPRIIYPRGRLIVPAATAAGDVSLTAPLLGSASVLYAPSVAPALAVTAPLLASASALYAPTVVQTREVEAPLLTSTGAQYDPSVAVVLNPAAPFLASASLLYAHSVAVQFTVTAPLLSSASALYDPSVSFTFEAAPPLLASTSALYAPSASAVFNVTPPLLASGSTFYAPAVNAVFTATAPLLASSSTLYAHSVAPVLGLSAPLLTSASALYAPSIALTLSITAPLLASASVLYDHAVVVPGGVLPPLLGSGSVLYAHAVALSITLDAPLLGSGSNLFSPTVSVLGVVTDTGAPLPTGHGLPYGWWRDLDEAEEDLAAAKAAIAEARKQIKTGRIEPSVVARIDAAAWWSDFEAAALTARHVLDTAAKAEARRALNELAAQVRAHEAEVARLKRKLAAERDEEEALFLLLH